MEEIIFYILKIKSLSERLSNYFWFKGFEDNYFCKIRSMGFFRFYIREVFVEFSEFFYGGFEGYDFIVGVERIFYFRFFYDGWDSFCREGDAVISKGLLYG